MLIINNNDVVKQLQDLRRQLIQNETDIIRLQNRNAQIGTQPIQFAGIPPFVPPASSSQFSSSIESSRLSSSVESSQQSSLFSSSISSGVSSSFSSSSNISSSVVSSSIGSSSFESSSNVSSSKESSSIYSTGSSFCVACGPVCNCIPNVLTFTFTDPNPLVGCCVPANGSSVTVTKTHDSPSGDDYWVTPCIGISGAGCNAGSAPGGFQIFTQMKFRLRCTNQFNPDGTSNRWLRLEWNTYSFGSCTPEDMSFSIWSAPSILTCRPFYAAYDVSPLNGAGAISCTLIVEITH